ncbi:MAG: DeoR family transcriptional regulator [Anaerolineaceae bacterium]|nr:DeoR family transcriptional regulator [Anaerolineaceae bacterium]
MKPFAHRREKILELISENSVATVAELAGEFHCSAMTIRRDLAELESRGQVERSRGGAIATRRIALEFALAERAGLHAAEKAAIGRAAAGLVRAGERIIIDTGTTPLALARELASREGISVVTPSLAVVSVLLQSSGVECMLLGGIVRESSPDLYGPLVEENLSRIHADWAFVGCDGLTVGGGLTTTDLRVARAMALMMSNAAKVVLLMDSSKTAKDSFFKFAGIDDLDYIITDDRVSADVLEAAGAAGAETIVVSVRE